MKQIIVVLAFLTLFTTGLSATADSYACKEECSKCISVCKKTLVHCTEIGGEHAQEEHIKVLKDCIAACQDAFIAIAKKDSTDEKFRCGACLDGAIRLQNFVVP